MPIEDHRSRVPGQVSRHVVMAFEEEFGIEIPDDAAEKIQTVKDAIDYISANA